MKQTGPSLLRTALILGALSLSTVAVPAQAGSTIARACLSTPNGAAAPALCTCIQNVADKTLSAAEQAVGAQIFLEPHMSQEIRASANRGGAMDAHFWQRWNDFGAKAASACQ